VSLVVLPSELPQRVGGAVEGYRTGGAPDLRVRRNIDRAVDLASCALNDDGPAAVQRRLKPGGIGAARAGIGARIGRDRQGGAARAVGRAVEGLTGERPAASVGGPKTGPCSSTALRLNDECRLRRRGARSAPSTMIEL
jgi:hypothetical protein